MTPDQIRDYLQEHGYRAETMESAEASTIFSGVGGVPFQIIFLRDEPFDGDVEAFDAVMFYAAAALSDGTSLERLNAANAQASFISSYFEEEMVHYRWDIPATNDSFSEELFINALDAWAYWLPEAVRQTVL